MTLTDSTRHVLAWLRAGHPAGYPYADLPSAVLVLERDRLSEGDIAYLAEFARVHRSDRLAIAVEITRVLDALPHPEDVERVLHAVAA